ncbi:MAG: hypothetical protein L0G70_03225 [Rubrobacter sp.]|nr:hypothetical protein [Rubrobacter sp.]
MSEDMQKKVISGLASVIAGQLATKLAGRWLDQPEIRGVRDDVKEAALKGAFSLVATVVASVLIRQVVMRNWK